jgi:hypothetical protein
VRDPGRVGRHGADDGRAGVPRAQERHGLVRPLRRHDRAEPAPHVEHPPHLGRLHAAPFRDQPEHRRRGEGRVDLKADVGAQPQEILQPIAGDVGEAVHRNVGSQQLEHRADVDHRGLEQDVGDAGSAQLVGPVVEGQAAVLEQGAARQRQPVRVHARRGQADHGVAGRAGRTGDDGVERDGPERRRTEVESTRAGVPAYQLRELGELSPRDLHAGLLGAGAQAARDRLAHLRVGALDGQVVEQGERLGADAHKVVDVHGHAVDPDGVVALRLLGDDHLRAHAVGARRQSEVRGDLDHAGEVAGQRHDARGTSRVDRAEHTHERLHGAPGVAGVHSGPRVCLAHRRRFCRSRRITSPASPAR